LLRPCTREDEEDLYKLYWNTLPDAITCPPEKICRPNRRDIREENEYYLDFVHSSQLCSFGRVMMVRKEDGAKIGTCLMVRHVFTPEEVTLCADPQSGLTRFGSLEVVIHGAVNKMYRGMGYAAEVAQALVHYGLYDLRLERVLSETTDDNPASIRVMEKVGMEIVSPPDSTQVIGLIRRS
jgi:RimJ/RimL family protein N-acetyltransferase